CPVLASPGAARTKPRHRRADGRPDAPKHRGRGCRGTHRIRGPRRVGDHLPVRTTARRRAAVTSSRRGCDVGHRPPSARRAGCPPAARPREVATGAVPPAGRTRAGLPVLRARDAPRGILHAGPPLWWVPGDAPRPRLWLAVPGAHPVRGARAVFTPGIATPRVRGASMCDACEAVVLDPRA